LAAVISASVLSHAFTFQHYYESLHPVFTQVSMSGEWVPWVNKVPKIEVETHKVASPDVVVPTLDTVRHEALLYTWLAEHKPMVLCGPPGTTAYFLICFKQDEKICM